MPQPFATPNVGTPFASSAISGHFDTKTAATEIADTLFDELSAPDSSAGCDLLLLFGSFHHRAALDDAAAILRKAISPGAMLGVTAEAVIGSDRELEGVAGLSAIALRLPGVRVHPWHSTPDDPVPLDNPQAIRDRIGFNEDFRTAEDQASFRGRVSTRWNWPIFDDRVTIYHYHEIFPSLQTFSDFFFTMDNGIRFKILEGLASGFQVTTRYNNRPPAGTLPTDNLYLLTLGYAFDTTRKR